MGYLGLAQIVSFTHEHNEEAKKVYNDSIQYDYPLAIAGINFSSNIYDWVENRAAARYIYSLRSGPSLLSVHDLYAQLFCAFNAEWIRQKPANMLAFERIRQEVVIDCEKKLGRGRDLYAFATKPLGKMKSLKVSAKGYGDRGSTMADEVSSPSDVL